MKKKSMKERKSHMTNAISFKARAVYLDEEPRTESSVISAELLMIEESLTHTEEGGDIYYT
jgi:hypothetical protein